MSTDAAKNRILQRIVLPELIGEKVELKLRAGKYVGLCPFHEERSGSFTVFDDHYFCFGCRARGDAITFVRETQGLAYIEALRYLAEKFSIDCPELEKPTHDREQRQVEAQLYKICAESATYYKENLGKPGGKEAREYLASRGFQDAFIDAHRFGLSLPDSGALTQHLLRKGFAVKDIITASMGLASQYDNRAYDFFTNRLMIPIFDIHGRVIAFGGRTMGNDPAKYKNSQNTPLFDKSHVLFGLHYNKDEMRRGRQAIVCEGYMDVLQLWQSGIPTAVACMGTALTVSQLKRLAALSPQVYLVFDGDRAGRNATLRTVNVALEVPSAECKVVVLPAGEDPDSFVRAHGADAFRGQLESAHGLLEFAVQTRINETHELGIPELFNKEFVPWLLSVKDSVSRNYLTHKIADMTGIAASEIEQALKQEQPKKAGAQMIKAEAPVQPVRVEGRPLRGMELEFFGHIYWAAPDELELDSLEYMLKSQLDLDELWVECGLELLKALRRKLAPSQQNKAFWSTSAAPEVLDMLVNLEKNAAAFVTNARQKQLEKLAREIRRRHLKESLSRLKERFHKAREDEQKEILLVVAKITKELNQKDLGESRAP